MEALTAVSVACLTIYDMAKAVDRGMRIEGVRLIEKRGGKSGHFRAGGQMKEPLLAVAEALARVLAAATPLDGGRGRARATPSAARLAEPIIAGRTQPPFANSAMDGYALSARDAAAPGARLRVVGESAAGRALRRGAAAPARRRASSPARRCPPAPTPSPCRRTPSATASSLIARGRRAQPGDNVRNVGLDFRDGEPLLPAGRRLTPRDVALIAAANRPTARVRRKPRVAILATGDELRAPGETLGPAQIVASNNLFVAGLARRRGRGGDRPRHRRRPPGSARRTHRGRARGRAPTCWSRSAAPRSATTISCRRR